MTVQNLELKIPPVLITLIFAALMWSFGLLLPSSPIPEPFGLAIMVLFVCFGSFFSLAGVASFRKEKTTVNPITPDACSSLVTSGIYTKTRNPMYLGFMFFLLAWGVLLSNFYSLSLVMVYILYMNYFQIRIEEKALETLFGDEYLVYKSRVRRWL